MAAINLTVSITTMNINGLDAQINDVENKAKQKN